MMHINISVAIAHQGNKYLKFTCSYIKELIIQVKQKEQYDTRIIFETTRESNRLQLLYPDSKAPEAHIL